jgi:hypothetical protein
MGSVDGTTAARGIVFPGDALGGRSTTRAGAAIVAAALEPMSPAHAADARAERHWRRRYPAHFRRLVEDGLAAPGRVVDGARAGLDAAWSTLCWADDAGERPLADAWPRLLAEAAPLHTATLVGRGDPAPAPWAVPYRGDLLTGDRLRAQVDDWGARGIVEPSAVRALHRCVAHPEWFDLSDRTLVLLGAASEAGPLGWLARWRARLVAVDIDRPAPWQRVVRLVAEGNATLLAPLRAPLARGESTEDWSAHAGADLLRETPAIAAWVRAVTAGGPAPDVAALAYLDGERHVRVVLAMDAVQRAVCASRHDASLAFLATPTDVFAVPGETARAALDAWAQRPAVSRALQGSLRLAAGERFFHPAVESLVRTPDGVDYGVVDCLVIEQGPNYALAKRLQQWRALAARAAGHRVSLNVAPSTTTASVVKNPALAAGFAGADTFGIEVFEPATTNALMAALWVHDLRCTDCAAQPGHRLAHPFELFIENAAHGGLWRSAYLPRSALPFAAALGWVRQRGRALGAID